MTPEQLDALLDGADTMKVAVVGDVMVDIYTMGSVNRISPEAPVPVVEIVGRQASPGGAANAAVCVAALGPATTMFGTIGEDVEGGELEEMLRERNVGSALAVSDTEPTITKHRIWSDNQQLLRLDNEKRPQPGAARTRLESTLDVAGYDAILISDYGKGVIDADSAQWLVEASRAAGVPVVIDPKDADFSMYRGCSVLKPNEKEARLAFLTRFGRDGSIEEIGRHLVDEVADTVAITRGPNGIDLFTKDGFENFPVERQNVFDVTGAGDVAAATLAVCVALGRSVRDACVLANAAARISVRRVGTGAVTPADLHDEHHSAAAPGVSGPVDD